MNNYYDMNRDLKANRYAYDYWRDHVRARIKDPRKAAILAPEDPPHPFGAKRLSLEQDFYDSMNKPNVDVVDTTSNPVARFEPKGIRMRDGTLHELDVIALATGFDAITGGINDIEIRGLGGKVLTEKWAKGTYTYLGMMTTGFPNMYFTYGPQGPTAFANGPTCNEIQGDWIVDLMDNMRAKGQTRVDARREQEVAWRENVQELSSAVVRGKTDSWYNGGNIPGKVREHLVYAGGIPLYMKIIGKEKAEGYPGFDVS
jgi:cation diffusion facilitator CzcD-associated flavoprotein CzcO